MLRSLFSSTSSTYWVNSSSNTLQVSFSLPQCFQNELSCFNNSCYSISFLFIAFLFLCFFKALFLFLICCWAQNVCWESQDHEFLINELANMWYLIIFFEIISSSFILICRPLFKLNPFSTAALPWLNTKMIFKMDKSSLNFSTCRCDWNGSHPINIFCQILSTRFCLT